MKLVDGVWVDAGSKTKKLQSNYDIWKEVFGGEYSLTLKSGKDSTNPDNYVLSENSAKQLVHAVNYVGTKKKGVSTALWQSDVDQPLKKALIDYVVTGGAIKQGATNVNSKEAYTNDNYQLTTMEINTHDAGVQLDAEHHADESVLSLMTQVVNALNARGYSTVKANAVYKALEGLVEDALGDYLSKNSDVVNQFISKVIVKALASNDVLQEGDLMGALLNTISDMYKEGSITSQEVLDSFPFDHPQILNNAVSKISSFLTSSAIKIKFPGSMSVLCPSNKIYKLFRDSLSDQYKDLVHFKGNVDNLGFGDPIKIGQIELGKTYIINGVKMKINTPSDYYELYDLLPIFEGMPYPEIKEDYSEGRDLAAYNITFTDSTGEVYNMWDLDAIRTMFTVNKNDRPQFLEQLQETLNTIKNGGTVKVRGQEITIVGEPVIHPYELICGYMYKTAFGLQEGDNVGQILSDPNFFVKRSLENFTSKILDKEFHVELKKVNGEHLYLVDSNGSIPSGLTKLKIEKRQIGDEVYRVDEHGSKMYSLSSMQDTVYVDKNGNQIIATKNIDYYIDKHQFVNMRLSSSIKPSTIEALTKLEHKVVRKCLKALSPDLNVETIKKSIPAHTKKLEEDIESLKEQLLKNKTLSSENEALQALIDSGNEVFASFQKSLEVLAARIPAQCHQSFMAMKIVGFDQSGLNNAYVNRMQLYLQGSDYDIDKVSLLGFKFKSGKFVKWSPFMNLSSLELLKASENIPFPTAKELVITEEYDPIWDQIIQSIEQTGLLTIEDYVEHNFSTVDQINLFATILDVVNESGLPEAVAESVYGKKLQNLINSHNKYLSRKGVDQKAALINFASTYMYNTSRDPKNLIQGQTSVDTPTKAVKKPAELQPMSRRSKLFGPGNPVSKIEQMILTLGGKENTSIVASALKVFEAISHSYYTALQTNDHTDRLFIGKEILGKNITLVANAYSQEHPEHSEMIKLALEQVDNITDAFVLFSALLSLSTDNAKDPTLTKINASPNMMPLYLAGLALGLDLTTQLIPLMTSDLAWKISSLMNSNVFVGNQGLFDVKAVINYIDNGPLEAYKALPIVIKQQIQNSLLYYIESRTGEKLELTRDDQVVRELIKYPSFDLEGVLYRLSKGKKADQKTEEEREEILQKSIKKEAKKILKSRLASLRNQIAKVKSQIVEDESTLVNKRAITKNEKLKDKLNQLQQQQQTQQDLYDHLKHNKVSDKVSQSLTEDYNQLIDSVSNMVSQQVSKGYKEILSYESNPTEAKKIRLQQRRFLKELRKYKRVKQLAFETIIINGEEHMVLPQLRRLQDMASEMSKTRSLVALNKGLPNSVPKLIKFIRDFESILGDVTEPDDIEGFAGRNQEWVGELTNVVDLKLFVTNADYRNFVIDEYEKVKKFINPFNVINYNPHYMGYLKAASIQKDLLFGTSRIIEVTDEISKNILNKYVRSTGESQKHIKKIQKFVVSRLNNYFMRANAKLIINPKEKFTKDGKIIPNDSEFTLMLGTPEANATFKYWMENEVIPTLKKQMYANRLIRDMQKMESSNTIDGNGTVSYALRFTNFPKTEEELRTFKEYKRSLKRLGSETYKGYSVQDLLFYYNLITFNGENLTGSFSALFEDIILDKSNSVINAFSLFYSQFGKQGQFKLGEDYTEDEILRFIAPTISVSGLSSNKLPYARVYNTNTMEYVLVKKVPEEIYSNNDPNIPTEAEMETGSSTNQFEAKLAQAYYEELDSQYSGQYFTYNYITSNEDIIPISGTIKYNKVSQIITINKKDYSLQELAKIAKDNGHLDVKESDIIQELQLIQDGEVITTIDTQITKNNIEEILKQKEC